MLLPSPYPDYSVIMGSGVGGRPYSMYLVSKSDFCLIFVEAFLLTFLYHLQLNNPDNFVCTNQFIVTVLKKEDTDNPNSLRCLK